MKFKGGYILKVSLKVIFVSIRNEGQFMSSSFITPDPIKVELLQFILEVTKELLPYTSNNDTITIDSTTSVGGMKFVRILKSIMNLDFRSKLNCKKRNLIVSFSKVNTCKYFLKQSLMKLTLSNKLYSLCIYSHKPGINLIVICY